MKPTNKPLSLKLMLLVLPLLLQACVASLPATPPLFVKPPAIPALPKEARQPQIPSVCLPTCSAALTKDRASWQAMLTVPELPVPLVSGSSVDYSLHPASKIPKPQYP